MKISLLLALIIFSSCSKSTKVTNTKENDVTVENSIQNITILNNNELESEVVDFGTMRFSNNRITKRVIIKNDSPSSINLVNLKAIIENYNTPAKPDAISIGLDTCSSKTLGRTKSCLIDITVAYNPEIVFDTAIELTNSVGTSPTISLYADFNTQNEADLADIGSALVIQNSNVDFGIISPSSLVIKRVYILNTKTVDSPGIPTPRLPSGLDVVRSTCSGIIKKLTSCFLDISYTAQEDNLNESVSLAGNFLNSNLNLSATNRAEISPSAPKLSLTYTDFPINTVSGKSYIRRIAVRNIQLSSNYSFGATEFSSILTTSTTTITNNTCDGRTLRVEQACFIDVKHTPTSDGQPVALSVSIPSANLSESISIGQTQTNNFVSIGNFSFLALQQPPGVKYFYSLANGNKFFFNVNPSIDNGDGSVTPGSTDIHLYNGTNTSLVKNVSQTEMNLIQVSELINNKYLLIVGNYTETPSLTRIQMKLVDITNNYSEITILDEISDNFGQIAKIVKYQGSSNNDKIVILSKQTNTPPFKYKIQALNETYDGLNTLVESAEFDNVMPLYNVSMYLTTQVNDKLFLTIAGLDPSVSSLSYILYAFDGATLTKTFQKNLPQQTNDNQSSVYVNDSVAFNNKLYQMITYRSNCSDSSSNPCHIENFLIESEGTAASTQVVDNFSHSFVPFQGQSGQELFESGWGSIFIDARIYNTTSGGLIYSWFDLELQDGFDYSVLGLDHQSDPCPGGTLNFACTDVNYKQQLGKTRVKKISSTGVKTNLLEVSTLYGYNFLNNPINFGGVRIDYMGKALNEVHLLKISQSEGSWYRTDSSLNSLVLVEDLNQSLGLNTSTGQIDIYTPMIQIGSNDLYFVAYFYSGGNKLCRKNGSNPSVPVVEESNGIFRVLNDRIYFDVYENNFQTLKLKYVENGIVNDEYEYPNLSYQFDVVNNELFLLETATKNIFIYK